MSLSAFAKKTMVLSIIKDTHLSPILIKILTKAYIKAGYKLKIHHLPPARAIRLANSGEIDGSVARTRFIEKNNPNLIRIPIKIYPFNTMAFTKNNININSVSDLAQVKSGFLLGHKQAENLVKTYKYTTSTYEKQLFQLLNNDRIDVAITELVSGKKTIKLLKLNNIVMQKKPLSSLSLYHYIHKKNKRLIPKISRILKEMHEKGELLNYYNTFIKEI